MVLDRWVYIVLPQGKCIAIDNDHSLRIHLDNHVKVPQLWLSAPRTECHRISASWAVPKQDCAVPTSSAARILCVKARIFFLALLFSRASLRSSSGSMMPSIIFARSGSLVLLCRFHTHISTFRPHSFLKRPNSLHVAAKSHAVMLLVLCHLAFEVQEHRLLSAINLKCYARSDEGFRSRRTLRRWCQRRRMRLQIRHEARS